MLLLKTTKTLSNIDFMLTMLPTFNLVDICFCCSFDIIVVSAVVTLVFVINDDANDVVCK